MSTTYSSLTPYPPCQIRSENHKREQRKIYRSARWRVAVRAFLKKNPICLYCRKPAQTAHHPIKRDYGSEEYYNLDDCEPVCNGCHLALSKGRHRCPKCDSHWTMGEFCKHCGTSDYAKARKRERSIKDHLKYLAKMQRERGIQYNLEQREKDVFGAVEVVRKDGYVHIKDIVAEIRANPETYPAMVKFSNLGMMRKIVQILKTANCWRANSKNELYYIRGMKR